MAIDRFLIEKQETIRVAMQKLNNANRVLFVVENDMLIGSITDGDVRRWILASGELDELVFKVMNKAPIAVKQAEKSTAQKMLLEHQVLAIPIVDDNNKIVEVVFWNSENLMPVKEINSKVVIMAGGKGERLMPFTSIVPKPLIPIGDKPIVELIIDSFKTYGCNDYFLTINYKKNMIKAYFDDLNKDYNVSFVEEDEPLGTGGSLFYLKGSLKETFFVSNCDILLDVDYSDIFEFHKEHKNHITVVTSMKNYVLPYGVINLAEGGYVESVIEKPATDYLINTGVYVIEPEVLDFLGEKEFVHITALIEKCINEDKRVGTYPISEESWMDMGQFEDMEKMKLRIVNK